MEQGGGGVAKKKARKGEGRPAGDLLPRHRAFALAYLESLNATEAYRRVYPGCTQGTAETNGTRLLGNARVWAFLQPRLKKREERLELTAERLDAELVRLALVDISKAYGDDGKLLPIRDMPEDVRRAIQGVETDELFETIEEEGPRGGKRKERVQVGFVKKVKFATKCEAISLAYRRLGLLKGTLAGDGDKQPTRVIYEFGEGA